MSGRTMFAASCRVIPEPLPPLTDTQPGGCGGAGPEPAPFAAPDPPPVLYVPDRTFLDGGWRLDVNTDPIDQ